MIGIEGIEESKASGIYQIFNKIIEESFPKLRKNKSRQIQEAQTEYQKIGQQDNRKNSPQHTIVKTLQYKQLHSTRVLKKKWFKERVLEASERKKEHRSHI